MSGAASGITKVFSSFGSGIARLGAVKSVGGALFTGAAASGTSIGGGGLSSIFGSGTLGSMFSGATRVLGGPITPLVDAAGTATRGFGTAVDTGITGSTAASTGLFGGGGGLLKGIGSFLGSETGMGLIGGLGQGLIASEKADAEMEDSQANRDFLMAKEQRLRDSYHVAENVLPGAGPFSDPTKRPTPAVAYGGRKRVEYDPIDGRIKTVPV